MLFVLFAFTLFLVFMPLQSLQALSLAMLSRTEGMMLALQALLLLPLLLKLFRCEIAIPRCLGPPLTLLAFLLKLSDKLASCLLVLPLFLRL